MRHTQPPNAGAGTSSKVPFRILMVGMATIVFLIVSVASVTLFISTDDPPPDDTWMLPKFTQGGGENNPLATFCEEIKDMANGPEFSKLPEDVRLVRPGHATEAWAALENWSAQMKSFDKLMQSDPATWRWPGGEQKARMDGDFKYLSRSVAVVHMLKIRALLLADEGKLNEAADEALKIAKIGKGATCAEGCLIHWLTGITFQFAGENNLKEVFKRTDQTSDSLLRIQEDIQSLEVDLKDYRFALQAEYLAFRNVLDDFAAGKFQLSELTASDDTDRPANDLPKIFFKRNRTLSEQLQIYRPLLEALDHGSGPEIIRSGKAIGQRFDDFKAHKFKYLVNSNAIGHIFLMLMSPVHVTVLEKNFISRARHRQTLIMLALRRYELEQGKLPEKLVELVPKYLLTVPLDPFNDAPMRWDAEKQVLYSVGADLTDDGGSISDPPKNKDKDIGDTYWWKKSAPPKNGA